MKITIAWLEKKNACQEGIDWFRNQKARDAVDVIRTLMNEDHFSWANWAIVRVMKRKQYLQYAIFSAEQAISIFEKKYPSDKRPREAIEMTRACLKNNATNNRKFAQAAAYAAQAAAQAAGGAQAAYAAYAAAQAAGAAQAAQAAYAAAYAAYAAYAAAYAAQAAAQAAGAAQAAQAAGAQAGAREVMQVKIINYGINLLREVK